jgi:CheY-like chemotaxis protein
MGLRSLLLCADEKVVRLVRRALSDLDIDVEHCDDADAAVRRLTRRRFEAVIVDCEDHFVAGRVFASVRSAPCNKQAIAVALIGEHADIRSVFTVGAHFVLYKPFSAERAKSSFRAARALMKCERRRNTRVAVEIAVNLSGLGKAAQRIVTSDLSEGGLAVQLPRRAKQKGPLRVKFSLPGTDHVVDCAAEIAWENPGLHTGIRFVDLTREQRTDLKSWITRHCPEIEKEDPPVPCKLTDLSPAACYLETPSPFPRRSRVMILMQSFDLSLHVEGIVRIMHPEAGMGVEFIQSTSQQRQQLEKFIHSLKNAGGSPPELEVEPEGMDEGPEPTQSAQDDGDDELLDLFRHGKDLTAEAFQAELRKQRGSRGEAINAASV